MAQDKPGIFQDERMRNRALVQDLSFVWAADSHLTANIQGILTCCESYTRTLLSKK